MGGVGDWPQLVMPGVVQLGGVAHVCNGNRKTHLLLRSSSMSPRPHGWTWSGASSRAGTVGAGQVQIMEGPSRESVFCLPLPGRLERWSVLMVGCQPGWLPEGGTPGKTSTENSGHCNVSCEVKVSSGVKAASFWWLDV